MEEEKKGLGMNKFIVPIVAVAIFTLVLFGAGYAYFAATVGAENVTNISASIPAATTSVSTTSNTCTINVAASDMAEARNSATNEINNSSCFLNVTLNGAAGVKCTYDVILTEVSDSAYARTGECIKSSLSSETACKNGGFTWHGTYCADDTKTTSDACTDGTWTRIGTNTNPLQNINYEFTGTVNATISTGGSNAVEYTKETSSASSTIQGREVQLDTLVGSMYYNSTATTGLIAKGTIEVQTDGTAVSQEYVFEEKWYNIPIPQGVHSNKVYSYVLSAQNIVC